MSNFCFAPPLEKSPYLWFAKLGDCELGVHLYDGWCMQLGPELVFFNSEEKCMLLLPILEVDKEFFLDTLKEIGFLNPVYAQSLKIFPEIFLLKYVFLNSVSGYWPEKALVWLVSDKELQVFLKSELEVISKNRAMPQRLRHQVNKILSSICFCGH